MRNLNLTPRAQKLVKEAHNLASEMKHEFINHLHFFASFFALKNNQIQEAFENFEIETEQVEAESIIVLAKEYEKQFPQNARQKNQYTKSILSESSKNLFKLAKELSVKYDHKYIGLEHLFLSLFEEPDDFLKSFLETQNINFEKIIDYVERILEEDDLINSSTTEEVNSPTPPRFNTNKYKLLNSCSINLNEQVLAGKINNLHINKDLIKKISEILCRKNKNNPLIVGEAGVGKTALVESLAQAIVNSECSDFLLMKNIYALDVAMIVAGCKYRGEFEEKIKNILKEVANDPFVILFIDEIHTIIGAGNPQNGMDTANILKPYLARGEISCIGATTFDEYKKTIADDPALSRRFQTIKLEEPTKDKVFDLITNVKNTYEDYHVISFSDEIIKFTIDIAEKYIEGRFPDKALDIIDQVGAKMKLKNFAKTPEMLKLEEKVNKLFSEKEENAKNEELIKSLLLKYQKATEKMVNKWKNKKYQICEKDILEVVSDKTNIPLEDLERKDSEKILNLKDQLKNKIVGQSYQIEQIYKCLLRAKAGFRDEKKPIASMLFAGSTGVGKTMTAKILANNLFPNKNNFIFIDLSEYTDKTAVNKLIGSSPGYIGYDKGGVLTEKVKRNPYSLILFDEIQKADEDVLFLLLQILEEGKISDSSGKIIDFSNTIIVFTTNVGNQEVIAPKIGFNKQAPSGQNIITSVRKYFPPDFLNRIDEIIAFDALKEEHVNAIVTKELEKLKNDLSNKNIEISFDEKINEYIMSKIQFDNFGGRQIIKTIQRELQTLIAEKMLEDKKITKLKICVEKDKICVI